MAHINIKTRRFLSIFSPFVFLLGLGLCLEAQANLRVFACEPEWKSLTEELGGEKVKVISATTAFQDPHHIEARPSLIAKVRKSDLVVCTGSGLEDAWLMLLLKQSGNKKIQKGSDGFFLASEYVERLEIPEHLDRSMGDIHGEGNPHVHLGPKGMLDIAQYLSERLISIDGTNQLFYEERFKTFSERWLKSIKHWEKEAERLKNKKVIVYHRNWSYFLAWIGMQEVADLEPKPGIPPSTAHLVKLLKLVEQNKPDFILIAPYQNQKGAKWLSERTGIPIVELPFTIGGSKSATDLFSLYEETLQLLKELPLRAQP
jgi:zinc/manganese transport system substrate-binding protein